MNDLLVDLDKLFKQNADVMEKVKDIIPYGQLELKAGILSFKYNGVVNIVDVLIEVLPKLKPLTDTYDFSITAVGNGVNIEMILKK